MPDRPLTIATYAAGASLAAITLVYVFGPTFFIDNESNSASSRKRGVVGLSNPANDCFINSVLQALAGLGDLRLYLIRETHRRSLDGPIAYAQLITDPARPNLPAWKIEGLQAGFVTQGLKEILDALNERPIYKKTISAAGFVQVLEHAFKQRISRQQQDAQEFLQVVAERLCDEYHAGQRVRKHMRQINGAELARPASNEKSADSDLENLTSQEIGLEDTTRKTLEPLEERQPESNPQKSGAAAYTLEKQQHISNADIALEEEDGFPLEGVSESHIECTTCRFKPKPRRSTFCTLTLSVPQVSSTSLSSCFDQLFKKEEIDDFKCEKCRLVHAIETFQQEMAKSNSEKFKAKTQEAIERIQLTIETNPEEEIKDVELPDMRFAPKRKIAKHLRITKFPKVLAIHLSRSIFDVRSALKNSAKVSFPERLPLGGLLNQKMYRLLSVVCHKGSHHSGHYESFRRQNLYPPFATSNTFQVSGVYSKPTTPIPSAISTPQIGALKQASESSPETSTLSSTPDLLSPSTLSTPSTPSLPFIDQRRSTDSRRSINGRTHSSSESTIASADSTAKPAPPTSAPRQTETSSIKSIARTVRSTISKVNSKDPSSPSNMTAQGETRGLRPGSAAKDITRLPINGFAGNEKRKKPQSNRWWRISDEKVKECKTSDVLGMQKEVYLLFYELEKGEDEV